VVDVLAAAAATWGVAMALSPLLQIREIRRTRSSANVSIAYQQVLFVGFMLWLAYGIAASNLALIVPNTVALVVCVTSIVVSLRYRRPADATEIDEARRL
jgi:MtN3 and saliva related transmembrane protein